MSFTHYTEASFVPNEDVSVGFLFSAMLGRIRRIEAPFAVAFPNAFVGQAADPENGRRARQPPGLGSTLQVFADRDTVRQVAAALDRYREYAEIEPPLPVGGNPSRFLRHVRVRDAARTEAKIERELRRTRRRASAGRRPSAEDAGAGRGSVEVVGPVSEAEIKERKHSRRQSVYPHLHVRSHSNSQAFRIAFRTEVLDTPVEGPFDPYGFPKPPHADTCALHRGGACDCAATRAQGATVPFIPSP